MTVQPKGALMGVVQIRELRVILSITCWSRKSKGPTDCDCLTLVWCLQRQKTPVIMLPIEAKTDTMPAALEVDWISGTESRPTVALQQQPGFSEG